MALSYLITCMTCVTGVVPGIAFLPVLDIVHSSE